MARTEAAGTDEAPKATDPTEASVTAEAAASNTEAPKDEAPAEDEAPKIPMKDLTGIQYIGSADIKSFTALDLGRVGVVDPKGDLRWDSQNDHTVAISDVNASTLEYLRSQPDDFRIF